VLLFQRRFHAGLLDGSITLTFRRWEKPHVKAGGRYRVHPIGVVQVDDVRVVRLREVTARDARAAGFAGVAELHAHLAAPVKVRGGPAIEHDLSPEDVAEIARRLARLDAKGPWTRETLALIGRHPRVAASKLARKLGRETLPFKVDVRKLKRLGLTASYEVGYEVSPRGRAFLRARPRG
jgi:hypothetical protein